MPDCPQGERIPGENPPVAAIPYALFVLPPACEMSDSYFKQSASKWPKLRRPCSRKARGAPGFPIPSLTRGMLPHKREGSGAPKGAGRHFNALRRTSSDVGRSPRGAPLRRFSLVLGTAFWKRTGAPIRTPLIPRGFPRFHPLHQPVAGRTHVVRPGDVSRGPRRFGWLGRTLRLRARSTI